MPSTTIHIPSDLLAAVDARARASGTSRNRLILRAVERLVQEEETWDVSFLEQLGRPLSKGDAQGVAEMMDGIQHSRTRKAPPRL